MNIVIEPQGAGTYEMTSTSGALDTISWTAYNINFTPAEGYFLDNIICEAYERYVDTNGVVFQDGTVTYTVSNPTHPRPVDPYLINGTVDAVDNNPNWLHDYGYYYEHTVLSVTAVFRERQDDTKYRVSTECDPVNAGFTGGDGYYKRGAVCLIHAKAKCSPWKFDHWELTPGGSVLTPEHSFVVNADTTCIAKFTHSNTGKLYDVDGKILCTADGDILYDGDLVTA